MEGKEKWYDIPGFSKYQISDDCKVRNKRTGYIKNIYISHDVCYCTLQRDDIKGCWTTTVTRFLAAAICKVNPMDIPRSVVCSFEGGRLCRENLKIESYENAIDARLKKMSKGRCGYGRDYYERCERFSRCVLNNDTQGLYIFIEEHRAAIEKVIRRCVRGEENIRKTYDLYVSWLIEGVFDGRLYVADIVSYTQKVFSRRAKRGRPIDPDDSSVSKKMLFGYSHKT